MASPFGSAICFSDYKANEGLLRGGQFTTGAGCPNHCDRRWSERWCNCICDLKAAKPFGRPIQSLPVIQHRRRFHTTENRAVAALNKLTFQIIASKSGKLLYETEFGKRGPTVNAALPLVFDDKLFLSSSYNVGARLINLADGNKTIWENDSSMSSQYTTCVYHEGFLYGTNGREDFGNGALRCVNALTGKVAWEEEQFGLAHLIKAEDQMLIWNIDGTVTLADLNSKSFLKKESAIVFSGNAKSLPALSNGRLFVKSNAESGSGKIVCLQVGESK